MYMRRRGAKDIFREAPPPERKWGGHATSPYCIRRIIATDTLAVGMASLSIKNAAVFGVYFHNLDRLDLCQATYAHYVAFASEGWFYAPFVLIVANNVSYDDEGNRLKSVAQRSGGVNQQLTYPGHHEIVGLLWHMIHVADIMMAPAGNSFACEGAWCGRLELSPEDSWEEILAKSAATADDPLRFVPAD